MYHFLGGDFTNKQYHTIFVFFSLRFPRSIHVAANAIISFFLAGEQQSVVELRGTLCVHSSVRGRLACVRVLVTVNSTAVDVGAHVPFWTVFFSIYTAQEENIS